MKPLWINCLLILITGAGRVASQPDDGLYTSLLQHYVDANGLVDYAALKADPGLDRYLSSVAEIDPATLPEGAARLAFWLNAYNAYTLKLIADNYPVQSINDLATGGKYIGYLIGKTPWDIKFATIHGERVTLNYIEHDIIRKQFREPRIHFALVCAAKSCPKLRREAYAGDSLEMQLADQLDGFLHDRTKNRFSVPLRMAEVSKVFDWFKSDFGTADTEVLEFVAEYAPKRASLSIRRAPDTWKLGYMNYDWALNAQP